MIEWDDDIDIGMLRKDYEKFRKVACKELNKNLEYCSWKNNENVHYFYDKIRLKGTYFSTEYSNQFNINNGIFVDITVYDKTSNYGIIQSIHIFFIRALRSIINIKWINKPTKKHPIISRLILPIVRLISFNHLHNTYETVISIFDRNDTSEYLVDGGDKIGYGAFPKEWLSNYVKSKFEDISLFIPSDYNRFLSFFYGKDYYMLPNISNRKPAHNIIRIDLGKYLFKNDE